MEPQLLPIIFLLELKYMIIHNFVQLIKKMSDQKQFDRESIIRHDIRIVI